MYQRMCVITTLNQEFRSFLVDTFSTDMPTKKISHRLHTYTHTIRSKTKIIKLCVCVCVSNMCPSNTVNIKQT